MSIRRIVSELFCGRNLVAQLIQVETERKLLILDDDNKTKCG